MSDEALKTAWDASAGYDSRNMYDAPNGITMDMWVIAITSEMQERNLPRFGSEIDSMIEQVASLLTGYFPEHQ